MYVYLYNILVDINPQLYVMEFLHENDIVSIESYASKKILSKVWKGYLIKYICVCETFEVSVCLWI